MKKKQTVIDEIFAAFQDMEFPGERFLQGSFDGLEPDEEIDPFRAQKDWTALDAEFLDRHASALNFFSEAGFRFYLPAYLIADLNEQLKIADPVFHLTHGFFEFSVDVPIGKRDFIIKSGGSTLINPRRYGAATFDDYARYRLSIFTREEARAIVAYLDFKCKVDPNNDHRLMVKAALDAFWLERARTAPTMEVLRQHLADQKEYFIALQEKGNDSE